MTLTTVGCIGVGILIVLLFLRVPIGFLFAAIGFCGLWYISGLQPALQAIGSVPVQAASTYMWTTMPMFVFMGFIAMETHIIEEFYAGVRSWVGQFRGGLLHAVIIGNAAFGAVCSNTLSAAATFSAVSLPEMRRYNYDDGLSLGAVGAGSVLSILIPPSIAFIIFGGITQTSIGELFIGGIVPGIVLMLLYMITIIIICQFNPSLAPPGPRTTWKEKVKATPGMWMLAVIFALIIGGLYLGLFTPTEAGGVGVFVLFVFGLARRKLSWSGFKNAVLMSGVTTGMIFFLLAGTYVFNLFIILTGLSKAVAALMLSISSSPAVFLVLVAVVNLILGTFMDAATLMLLMIPILFPVSNAFGIDPIVFCLVITIAGGTGGLTPPYGIMVFVISGVVKDVPMYSIFRWCAPFIVAIMLCAGLVIWYPPLATWLPGLMK